MDMPSVIDRSPTEQENSATAPTAFYIPSLDGIRAIAFATVFISHANGDRAGMFGVTVFFFLSGYLITTLLRREQDRHGSVSLSRFYLRRSLRIIPPLYVVLLTVFLLDRVHWYRIDPAPSNWSYAAGALFFTNYQIIFFPAKANRALGPFWSLAVEEHFYLLFPLVFIVMNRLRIAYRKQALILAGFAALLLTWRIVLVTGHPGLRESRILYGTDTRIDSILFGCIMAFAFNPMLDQGLKPSRALTGLAAVTLIGSVLIHNQFYRETFHFTVQGLALIPLFIAAISYSDTWMRWLNSKRLRFVGSLSYTLYLIHRSLLLVAFQRIAVIPLAIGVALVASFAYASFVNHFVERPFNVWRKRLST